MATPRWSADDLPDLSGRTLVVTGANSGIGFEAARELAGAGAHVVLACRDLSKAEAAAEAILAAAPEGAVQVRELDLARLDSVRKFAESFRAEHAQLHALVNNAGVMALPYRKTADGFEMQLGTNHLGHFALTGLLLEPLLAAPGSRVVNVSSEFHRIGRIRFDDLHGERSYQKWLAYAQSKLANLLFTYELQRKLEAAGEDTISLACHPGYAATGLQFAGARMEGSSLMERFFQLGNGLLAQPAAMGALPTLFATAAPEALGGDYIGPGGLGHMRGHPTRQRSIARSHDRETAARLWEVSEAQTGVSYDALT